MNNKVCIELHTDNNYAIPAIVTITSILKNKNPDSLYEIRLLGNNLSDENIKLIEKTGVKVTPHKNSFTQFEGSHIFVSSTDLFKFDLPEVLSDWDKVLYIDTDMIIQNDLSELFNTELGDNYVAAVKDMAGMIKGKHHTRNNLTNYFNAGMMLLNLKKMREDGIKAKLIDYKLYKDLGYFMSQDALNCTFEEKVVWLPPKYNYMAPNLTDFTANEICKFYNISEKEYNSLINNAVIIHMTNKDKPWNYTDTYGHKIWMKYFKKSVATHKHLNLKSLNKPKYRLFLDKIFSVKNETINNKQFKVWTVFGLRIKYKKKEKIK